MTDWTKEEDEAFNSVEKQSNLGKQILRDVMARYIPADIVEAEKQGFSSPDASWFRGESIDFVSRTLLDGRAEIYRWLDHDVVSALVNEHISGKRNRRLLIWSLINLEQIAAEIEPR